MERLCVLVQWLPTDQTGAAKIGDAVKGAGFKQFRHGTKCAVVYVRKHNS
ncbi:MAG: hypothetical protein WBX01_07705 [Nitrososphaeraceae archaeon]